MRPARRVQILLACFRSDAASDSSASIVVAYVYCQKDRVTIAPVHSALEETTVITFLRELIEQIGADPYSKLVSLRLPDWSFEAPSIH